MKRVLYHGSEFIIEKPTYGVGNLFNDYGRGFYCCTNKELAKEWAARKSGYGYVNKYEFRDDRLNILDLTKPPFDNILYWVTTLIFHRKKAYDLYDSYPREFDYLRKHYYIDTDDYDVIIGYRADDSYFHFPEAFLRSEITLESLIKIFEAGELGTQYVLISKRAFDLLHFDNYESVDFKYKGDYYSRKELANKAFAKYLKDDQYSKGTRLRDLVMNND